VWVSQAGVVELSEILPKAGLVYSEKGNLSELLCKPKLLPLKSVTLQRIEEMEQRLQQLNKQQT
jgi:BBSome-interacting protein 1